MKTEQMEKALQELVSTVNATGGVYRLNGRIFGCAADQSWLDLALAYETACAALDLPIQIALEPCADCGIETNDPWLTNDGETLCRACYDQWQSRSREAA